MRKFSEVYNSSKKVVNEQKRAEADKDRIQLLKAIRRTYGISDFNSLSESEKTEYRNLILEMWDKTEGLNEKGINFINESEIVLNNETSNPNIMKYEAMEFSNNLSKYINGALGFNGDSLNPAELRNAINQKTGKNISDELFKKWFVTLVVNRLNKSDKF